MKFQWQEEGIACIVRALCQSGVPAIELGYYGGLPDGHVQGKPGLTADMPLSLLRDLTRDFPTTKFTVMIHAEISYPGRDFQKLYDAGIRLVRVVYHKHHAEHLETYIQAAHDAGLQASINLTMSSRYKREELLRLFFNVARSSPDIIYLADTNAAFYPNHIAALFEAFSSLTEIPTGFHGHDFLSLAFANALTAANHGARYVDGSLLGIGRGAGNLRTELWCITALSQQKGNFVVSELLPALEYIQQQLHYQGSDLMAVIAGAYNFTPPEEQLFRELATSNNGGNAALMACLYLSQHLTASQPFSTQ